MGESAVATHTPFSAYLQQLRRNRDFVVAQKGQDLGPCFQHFQMKNVTLKSPFFDCTHSIC